MVRKSKLKESSQLCDEVLWVDILDIETNNHWKTTNILPNYKNSDCTESRNMPRYAAAEADSDTEARILNIRGGVGRRQQQRRRNSDSGGKGGSVGGGGRAREAAAKGWIYVPVSRRSTWEACTEG